MKTREQWLQDSIKALKESVFKDAGIQVPDVYVSVGFPKGSRGKNKAIGQCHANILSADDKAHIFIHPMLDDSSRVLDVLVHELIHAVDNCEHGHKKEFAQMAKKCGLVGKMTATEAGFELGQRLNALVQELGEYPHAKLGEAEGDGEGKGSRLIKCECPDCGYIAYTTRKWITKTGKPICPECEIWMAQGVHLAPLARGGRGGLAKSARPFKRGDEMNECSWCLEEIVEGDFCSADCAKEFELEFTPIVLEPEKKDWIQDTDWDRVFSLWNNSPYPAQDS